MNDVIEECEEERSEGQERPATHGVIRPPGQHPVLHYGMRQERPGVDGARGEGAGREGCPLVLRQVYLGRIVISEIHLHVPYIHVYNDTNNIIIHVDGVTGTTTENDNLITLY